jgi:formate/nitrite transporter FocA (FNT family)
MGFSPITEGLLRSRLPDEKWRPVVTTLGYSSGFLLVIPGRQQLFTENTLMRPNWSTLRNVLRL